MDITFNGFIGLNFISNFSVSSMNSARNAYSSRTYLEIIKINI